MIDPHNEYATVSKDRRAGALTENMKLPFWRSIYEEIVDSCSAAGPAVDEEVEILAEADPSREVDCFSQSAERARGG